MTRRPERMTMGARLVLLAIALGGWMLPNVASAIPIEVNTFLLNKSFENPGSGCPVSWTCVDSAGSYVVTSSQYTAGADGLPGFLLVPDGASAGRIPAALAGAGSLSQITSGTWIAGQEYTFTFWYGIPKTTVEDGQPSIAPPTIRVMMLSNGVTDSLCGAPCQVDLVPPAVGQWQQYVYSFTPTQNTGQSIGVAFFASTDANHEGVNFDIGTPTAVPEPGSMMLLSSGFLALAGVLRKRRGR